MSTTNSETQVALDILIVEDSSTQAAQLKCFLETNQYRVRVVKNGVQAMRELHQEIPKIVISDVVMPEMDGYELCEKIKKDESLKHIPVILLTQLSTPKDIIRGLECGSDHFIIKPYNVNQLISHIQYIIMNRKLRRSTITDLGIEVYFAGQKHFLTSSRIQILDLLFSTYETVMQRNKELEENNKKLTESVEMIKMLSGLIPICSNCKKIRNDKGFWHHFEEILHEFSTAEITHGICPECENKLYGNLFNSSIEQTQ